MADMKEMLDAQWKLQVDDFNVGDPRLLEGDELMEYVRVMGLALVKEVGEALDETGWKTWASSNHMNRDAYVNELVDAWHILMNLLLAGAGDVSPYAIAQDFVERYFTKNKVNAQRQADGYTGLEKCPGCKRDLKDFVREAVNGDRYCAGCGKTLEMKMDDGSYQPV